MWVVLVVGILNKEYDSGNVDELQERLRAIPGDLHRLFRDILIRDSRENGRLLLCIQWVLFAKEPLTREQLYFAIHSGIKPLSAWDPDMITPSVMDRYVLDCSKGLAEVTKGKTQTVQFIHESVNDFLLRENGLMEIFSDLGTNFQGQSHERLKQCCLTQMTIATGTNLGLFLPKASSPEATQLRQSVDREFPFLKYAIQNVLYHGDAAEGGGVNQLGFIQTFQLDRWIPLYNLFEKYQVRRYTPDMSFLSILAEHNLGNLISIHPSNLCCFEVMSGRYGAPIFAALATNSGEAVRAFLEAQVHATPPTSLLRIAYKQYCQDANKQVSFRRNFVFNRERGVPFHLLQQDDEVILMAFLIRSDQIDIDLQDVFQRTPLSRASSMGQQVIVKWLIENGAELDSKDRFGQTPLSYAVANGHEAVLNSQDANDMTPLLYAASNGHEAILNSQDANDMTPLLYAASNGHEAICKLLLESGAEVNLQDEAGNTPLARAAACGHEGIVKVLLAVDRIDADRRDAFGRTPLILAILDDQLAIVRVLLKSGRVNVNALDDEKRTPLLLLLLNKCKTVTVVHHDERGTFVAIENIEPTYLSWNAQNTREEIARLLVDNGADVNLSDCDGRTPLSFAAERSNDNTITMLLEKGAAVDAKDNTGRTPLSWAAENSNNENGIRILLDNGAALESKDDVGRTPLSWTAGRCKNYVFHVRAWGYYNPWNSEGWNDMNIMRILLQAGANVESRDINGRTPLSWVAQSSHTEIFQVLPERENDTGIMSPPRASNPSTRSIRDITELLLENGADLNAKDHHGWTPLRWANDCGNEDAAKFLESAGAIQ
ncbi:ankyrin repeat-containing domain protein [Aspergillus pseudotamarii]|uniref:Ankyrin repeat-containing domain protein n=1 Tax=Aspergillus pseudotamarii TaxID=132259 RepID=A0A5N6T3X5_ASPPS|nr:ankyrin repeat-containing domain protein [Aspergillus pseudotamarii]KAE8141014.1 ankyrin repeat-containing domain protein [Aspergillus pseudotamarii]